MEIQYSDGRRVEQRIYELVRNSPPFSSRDQIYPSPCEWAVEYHLSPWRANLLRPFDFGGLEVLELGAGMGALSHFLAEECSHLTVVEGTRSRYAVIEERLRQFRNWEGHVGSFFELALRKKYDVVCLAGVLEYAELFIETPTPFASLLEKARLCLKEEGVLILAIENKLGLKYWLGCQEDHLPQPYAGICDYPPKPSLRTFSRNELLELLREAGFTDTQFYYPFPDYKIVRCVLSSELARLAPDLCLGLTTGSESRSYGSAARPLIPEVLAQRSVTRAGLFEEFSNSFLVLASARPEADVMGHLARRAAQGELAWSYSSNRKLPTETSFAKDSRDGSLKVSKQLISDASARERNLMGHGLSVKWKQQPPHPAERHTLLRVEMVKDAYFKTGRSLLPEFLGWVFGRFEADAAHLRGEALDTIFTNAFIREDDSFGLLDEEWELLSPLPKSWHLLRNLIALSGPNRRVYAGVVEEVSLKAAYLKLCRKFSLPPQYEADLRREAALQSLVTLTDDCEATYFSLKRNMEVKIERWSDRGPHLSLRERGTFRARERLKRYPRLFRLIKKLRPT